jgi:succinoglycan biosynthesis transport protein ExoP
VLPVSDAAILSTHADSIVYVVKFDSTGTEQIKAALQKLPRHHAPLAGIVLNQVDSRKAENYGDYKNDGYYEGTEADAKKERRIRHATAASL